MFRNILRTTLPALIFFYSLAGFANGTPSEVMAEVKQIQSRWAQLYFLDDFQNINYRELQNLAKNANHLSSTFPKSAEALTWDAIVLSSLAEKKRRGWRSKPGEGSAAKTGSCRENRS